MINGSTFGIDILLNLMGKVGASVLHLTAGLPPVYRVNGEIRSLPDLARVNPEASMLARQMDSLRPEDVGRMANQLLTEDRHRRTLSETGTAGLVRSIPGVGRFRVSVYNQRGSLAVACHALRDQVPSLGDMGDWVKDLLVLLETPGLVLVSGPAGSGKTTLLAAVVDHVNRTKARHIMVLENPIEYLHTHRRSMVNQRQVGEDVGSYFDGLESAMDQDVDMVVLGDMPDQKTVIRAIAAAETGKLVIGAVCATPGKPAERLMEIARGAGGVSLNQVFRGTVFLDKDHSVRIEGAREDG